MKRSSILFNLLGAVGLVGLLSGCGSGGGGASTGTASGSSAASGTITGFGSVIVNGKKFETNGALLMVDGQQVPCTVNQITKCGLKEGMTVKVSGTFSGSSRTASTITQEDTVEGPIQSVDVPNSSFVVLGQTVLVNDTTRFDPGVDLGNLASNQVVEVSGFVKDDGVIAASFIERKASSGGCSLGCEIKGTVKSHSHDTVPKTFQIGGLNVTYDNITIIGDMPVPSGSNWNGLLVEVKGTNFDSATATLIATKVEPENQGVQQVDEFEKEGFVTDEGVIGAGDFFIENTHVKTTSSTEFRGGTIDEIVKGVKLSAEGRLGADGILTAKHVKFHDSVKLEGNIATINGSTFTITGLPGVTVTVNSQTEGGNTLSSLSGQHVRVRGRVSGDSSVIATRVEQKSGDADVDLQGPVQDAPVLSPNLTILGVPVNTTGMRFEGLDDGVISSEAFFSVVEEGTLVKVKGKLVGGVVVWEEAELED